MRVGFGFFLSINLAIFLSYWLLLTRLGFNSIHKRSIFSGIFMFAQIILTELILGIAGLLDLSFLLYLNIVITLGLFIYSLILRRGRKNYPQGENQPFYKKFIQILSPGNITLSVLLIFVSIWVAVEVYFMPPRGFDEMAYHLTIIYEYIINHRIFLLPVDFYSHFSFPQNADLLFMWPAIFLHSQRFVDGVQFMVALWGISVIYGIARVLDIPAKIALFVSMLFIFTPVIFAQMGSAYIDIITAVFFLSAIYCALVFYKGGGVFYFYITALCAGLLLGMKYNQPFFILSLLPFLLTGKRHPLKKEWLVFLLVLLFCGGYWYLRNMLVFHSPFYRPVKFEEFEIFPLRSPLLKLLTVWKDPGLGNLNGGFGLVFWGLAVPAWFYVFIRAIGKRKNESEKALLWLALPFAMGILQLMMVSLEALHSSARYSLFIIPLGLLSLGKLLTLFNEFIIFRRGTQVVCIILGLFALLPFKGNRAPSGRMDAAISDTLRGRYLTEESYINWTSSFGEACGLLDYLTIDEAQGLSCYISPKLYRPWSSPIYGSRLQNRIWNFQREGTVLPDAFIYIIDPQGILNNKNEKITADEVKINPDYELIIQKEDLLLFMRKDFIENDKMQKKLNSYRKFIAARLKKKAK